jgi:hypothetical protein
MICNIVTYLCSRLSFHVLSLFIERKEQVPNNILIKELINQLTN